MFRHKCPGGTYCGWETLPQYQYELPCLEGFYCQRGTTAQMRQRDRCRVGYYCPPATAAASHPETRCPYFTTSTAAVGQSHIYDCLIDVQHVCDKKLASEFDPFDEQRYYRELTYSILDSSGERTTVGGTGEGEVTVVAKVMPVNARSPRVDVLRCLHFIRTTRLHERRRWVVSFSILSLGKTSGPRGVSQRPLS